MRINIFLLTVVIFFTQTSLVCHVYNAEVWKRGDKVCYCLGEIHESDLKKNFVSNNQRKDLLYAAKTIDALVVVEDIEGVTKKKKLNNESEVKIKEAIQGSKDMLHLYDLLIPGQSMLRGTSGLCYRAGIDVENVEFRFLAASDGNLTLGDEFCYFDKLISEIEGYNDETLKPFYSSVIKDYKDIINKEAKDFFDYLATKNTYITRDDIFEAPYTDTINIAYTKILPNENPELQCRYRKKEAVLKLYKTFFLDTNIARLIAQNIDRDRIVVCAGNAHIKRIAPALKALGYAKVDEWSGENADAIEPDAIDLHEFFAKHEPKYVAGDFEKTYIHRMLDMQCYFDKHPGIMIATGVTIVATLFTGIITCPVWCGAIARKLAPESPKIYAAIKKSLVSAVMAATVLGFYKSLAPIREF